MVQSIETLVATLAATTILSAVLLFLPAIYELKKPKDAGPRRITDSFEKTQLSLQRPAILNVDIELKFDPQLTSKIENSLCFIPKIDT